MNGIAVIGCGHWGKNYLRELLSYSTCQLKYGCDLNDKLFAPLKKLYPAVEYTTDLKKVLTDPDIKAVVIATPPQFHFAGCMEAIAAKKHILVEKPFTLNVEDAGKIIAAAESAGIILMVGHTFIYNSAVKKLKELLDQNRAGDLFYFKAVRTHLGLIREGVNCVWDLAPHDISIFNYLTGKRPVKVQAVGSNVLRPDKADAAFINLFYPGNIIANIHVSWAESNKVRTIDVIGSKARIVFDDINSLERVKIYEKGVTANVSRYSTFGEFSFSLRDGDIISPKIEYTEPLKNMCEHFLKCLETGQRPQTDGVSGLEVVRVLCGIDRSIHNNFQVESL
jgi:predicted dehydrogenase